MTIRNDIYRKKQEWMDAVMASDLSPATKVYAYGIFKHMYGDKVEAFPGKESLEMATGLSASKFYKHNEALATAGFLEITSRKGASNVYRLVVLPPAGGTYLPPQGGSVPPAGSTPTPTGGPNTTTDTSKKNPKEDTKGASAPVTQREDTGEMSQASFDAEKRSVTLLAAKRAAKKARRRLPEGCPVVIDERNGDHWNAIRKMRPLTSDERAHIAERARRFEEERHQREEAAAAEGW